MISCSERFQMTLRDLRDHVGNRRHLQKKKILASFNNHEEACNMLLWPFEKAGFKPRTLGTKVERYDHCATRPVEDIYIPIEQLLFSLRPPTCPHPWDRTTSPPPLSHYRAKSFPNTIIFPTQRKGSNQARNILQHMYSGPWLGLWVSIRASITNQMLAEWSRRPHQ